jgi:hypothetical protein
LQVIAPKTLYPPDCFIYKKTVMTPHIATGTFTDDNNAEDARSYLLANEFEDEQIELKGLTLNIHTKTLLEAQEAVDVLRNYGATGIDMFEEWQQGEPGPQDL